MKHDLFFELEAFNPRWQTRCRTVQAAAVAANVEKVFKQWLTTDEGQRYTALHSNVPDTLERVRQEQEAMASLPFTLTSLPTRPHDY